MFGYMEDAEKKAKELTMLYLAASRDIQQQAKKIFQKYQSRYGLSKKEAELLLGRAKRPADIKRIIELLKDDPRNAELVKELETQAYGARIGYLNGLYDQVESVVLSIYAAQQKQLHAFFLKLAKKAYYDSIFDIQQYAGYGFNFKLLSRGNIEKVLNSKWHGSNYSQRLWKNTDKLARAVKKEIMMNLLTGKPVKDMSEAIDKKFGAGYNEARRLIRTESSFVCNQMQLLSYGNCGIEKYIYVAVLDLKTSLVCRSLDKKVFPVKNATPGRNYPPMHPWCRSTTIAYMPQGLLHKLKRSAIDPSARRRIIVPGGMTYQQWHDKFVKGKQVAETQEKALKNKQADKEQFAKYKEIFGDEIPETIERFQDLKYNDPARWETLKAFKQKRLDQMDFSEMGGLIRKLGNKEVRSWYKTCDEKIPELIDKSLPLEGQARQACELRNQNRTHARELMKDQEQRKLLDLTDPNKSFDELLAYKINVKGLSYGEALKDILETATKTRDSVNRKLGLEG